MATGRPLRPEAYRAAARRLRAMADRLDACAAPETPRERASLTRAVHVLVDFSRTLSARHRRSTGL